MDVTENVPGVKFSVTTGCGRAMSVITPVRHMEEWMNYKLYYFPIRGRGEQVRLVLHTLEVPFEDVLVAIILSLVSMFLKKYLKI